MGVGRVEIALGLQDQLAELAGCTFTATGITFTGNTAPDGADVYHQDPGATPSVSTCSINGALIPQGTGTP